MFDTSAVPKFDNAPGLVIRPRKDGTFVAFWQARSDLVKRGFRPPMIPLWRGLEPSRADRSYVSDQCVMAQNEMLVWGRGGVPEITKYDGTVRSLIACYKTDRDSGYRKLRYRTRENYDSLCRRIERDRGDEVVSDVRARHLLRWHEDWNSDGHTAMAHSLVGMLRTLCTFGATMLESDACAKLKTTLGNMKFPMSKPRTERLTADHADAIRSKAHGMGFPSMALAQAFQFECTLRQRDVIGEWVPASEPGISDVTHAGQKWLRGIRWSEIDDNLILRHVTSKRLKEVEIDLRNAPMVLSELERQFGLDLSKGPDRSKMPRTGPVIVYEQTGRCYLTYQFRWLWRRVANLAGIPKAVRNMDSRAGAISEATDAGAALEDVRHAATHGDIKMTQRYSRGSAEKTAKVMQLRSAHRNKGGTP